MSTCRIVRGMPLALLRRYVIMLSVNVVPGHWFRFGTREPGARSQEPGARRCNREYAIPRRDWQTGATEWFNPAQPWPKPAPGFWLLTPVCYDPRVFRLLLLAHLLGLALGFGALLCQLVVLGRSKTLAGAAERIGSEHVAASI